MFSWSFSKSAEAMFSRWAVKRVCKFLLKKKLGKFILGDIDLDQLDVQLGAGTIQLSDLALNVDYINEKFATAAVLVKEGSVGSLTVTMPWKDGGCKVAVDELEVVLAPRRVKISPDESETCSHSKNGNNSLSHGPRKPDNETPNNVAANASVEVHEGVKIIAKMVKWLLTSFHVKIKKLIVAFDPLLEDQNREMLDKILVLRINELECGTHISEDASSSNFTKSHTILGFSRLTNFLEFKGAVLELLHVDGLDHHSPDCSIDTTIGDWYSGQSAAGNMSTIVSGEKGGFSGSLNLSLPWKNGSLDIRKVDANLHIEPLELRFEPSSIKCFIFMWDLIKGFSEQREERGPCDPSDSLSSSRSTMHPFDKGLLGGEGFVVNMMEKEPVHTLLSDSNFISDWVSKSQKGRNEEEPDFGASVDQFFECIDGLRNSQSALGNSGMWNWTCSVFSAITAASNLASGSLHVPSEQQRVETSFSASVEKVSVLLSFIDIDEDKKQSLKMKADVSDMSNADIHLHRVCAQFVDLDLVLKVHPQEMKFELIAQHIQVVDHFTSVIDLVDYKIHGQNQNPESEMALIQKIQDSVQGSLRTAQESTKDLGVGDHVNYADGCRHTKNVKDIFHNYTSVTLLKTSGVSSCHVSVNLGSGSSLMGPTSFTLKLPPFVCWVYFDMISMMLEFTKEMLNCIGTTSLGNNFAPESESKEYRLSAISDRGKFSHPQSTNASTRKFLAGNIFLSNARIILCFPSEDHNHFSSYSSCNQFIAFDLVSPSTPRKDDRSTKLSPLTSFDKRPTTTTSCSLNLNIGDIYLFYIRSKFKEKINRCETYDWQESSFSAEKIISIVNGTGHLSVVSMFWQEGPVTGPWIAKKAKLLASSQYGNSQEKAARKDSEFASVTTVRDSNGFDAQTRQEMLASSAFFLRGNLPPATINLDKAQYENISSLLNHMIEHFSCVITEPASEGDEHSVLQTSILFEFESVTISLSVEPIRDVKSSIRSELPSSWCGITLKVDKLELLSVSNIGGISGANFIWVSHGKGNLWGSTESLHQEFLLISCSDLTMGRGDGEGSNVLSSRSSGSDIINFWDPESNHSLTSISITCATIIAIGGRLDWFNSIISFFTLPHSGSQQSSDNCLEKNCGSSFVLNLVDVGLSYEPYIENLSGNLYPDLKSSDSSAKEYGDELYIACLLAASSLKLSNTTVTDCGEREYKIRLQDLGFLLCGVPESGLDGCTYSVEQLSNIGYVKISQEANVEAVLRINCENGHAWELECAESHISLNTCHDTTFGLIRLAAQLQKLFAPDMQDYVVHLENRWNSVKQAHEDSEEMTTGEFTPLHQSESSSHDEKSKVGNLMDEICEDAFQLNTNSDAQAKFFESHHCTVGSTSVVASGASSSGEKTSEIIEEYFLSDLRPLSELSLKNQSSDINSFNILAVEEGRIGNGGWYGGSTPLRILENHAPKVENPNVRKHVVSEVSTTDCKHVEDVISEGHILLKNMNVSWRMYGGSDWSNFQNTSPSLTSTRDVSSCFELALSGICFEYDVYPDGEISASSLSLTVKDFWLNDRSNDAPWKLVLGNYQSKKHPRKFSSKALKLNLEAVRPNPLIRIEENRLRIALLPLLLHLHQRQLDFLISFFGGKNSSAESSPSTTLGSSNTGESDKIQGHTINEEAFLTYFQKFDIWPMLVRVDYSPSRVDLAALRGGKYVELINLIPWKGVELQLKHVQGIGLYGWNTVCETIIGEWLEDISQNQVHKLLKGLPPIKSLVAVGSGAAKLVSMPVKNYKRDHRLLKGMQRGTFAFLRSISLEAIGLGVHLAAGAHNILLQAEYIMASIPPSVPWPLESEVGNRVNSNQPNDAQQGIQQACQSISDGLGKSAAALVQAPFKKYQRGASMGSALSTAVQSAPVAAIAPASAAVRAVHCALLGFRNSLDPEHKKESLEKYLGITPPQESKQ